MAEAASLYRRHRPQSFDEVVGQEHVVRTLRMLHKALTGSVPYPHERDVDKVMAHASGTPPAASEQVDSVPAELDAVVGRAMASKPEDRYQSAGELGNAAVQAASSAGPEPDEPIRFPASGAADVDSDAPTAG